MTDSVFKSYFDESEKVLIAKGRVPSHVSHNGNKGVARETFVREFLAPNVGNGVIVGQGQIIDASSKVGEPRKQQDIVLYNSALPRLHVSSEITSFLREGVHATIEVKTTLTQNDLSEACEAALQLSGPERGFSQDDAQNEPRRFVVAYDGPAKMDTVFKWLETYYRSRHAPGPHYRLLQECWSPLDEFPLRHRTRSRTVDGVFVLGRGFVLFEGFHFSLETPAPAPADKRRVEFHGWTICDTEVGALHALFVAMTDAIHNKKTIVEQYAKELQQLTRTTRVMNCNVRV